MSKWESFVSLHWYDGLIEFMFRFVAKTSEPLLALGLIISAADVLTKGRLMDGNLPLADAWAWTQAIAIESSGGVVLVYALQSFRQQDKVKGWLYIVLSMLLAIVGGMMLYSQLLSNATGALDSFAVGTSWQVQTLVILRVIVSVGYVVMCRTKHIRFNDLSDAISPAPSISTEHMSIILAKLEKLEAIEQAVTGQMQTIVISEEQPVLSERTVSNEVSTVSSEVSIEQKIRKLLASDSSLSARAIAKRIGCSPTTASTWMKRIQSSQ